MVTLANVKIFKVETVCRKLTSSQASPGHHWDQILDSKKPNKQLFRRLKRLRTHQGEVNRRDILHDMNPPMGQLVEPAGQHKKEFSEDPNNNLD